MELVCFSNSGRGSLEGHLCQSTVKSAVKFQRRILLFLFYLFIFYLFLFIFYFFYFYLFFCFLSPWQQEFCMDLLHLSNYDKGPFMDYFCEDLLKLARRFLQRYHLKQFLTTHDSRRTPDAGHRPGTMAR